MNEAWSRSARRFVAVIALAAAIGGAVSFEAASSAKAQRTALDRELDLFGEVIEQVHARYVDEPNDKKLIEGAINGMLSALDPHSAYMSEEEYQAMDRDISGQFGGVGLEVEAGKDGVHIISVLDGTPASKSGLRSNDTIVKIDETSTEGMPLEKAVDRMHGKPGSNVTLTVTRNGTEGPISVTLRRDIIHVSPVQQRAEGNVAYIKVATFNGQTAEKLAGAITDLKKRMGPELRGYVLDLRNNPGGLLDQAIAVSSEVLSKGTIVSIKGRHKSDVESISADSPDMTGGKPIVVLVNSGTASAAEIVAGALQDDKRAFVVGTRSFGKGTVQTILPLGGGRGALRLTTARYFTPSGRSIQARGIDPDVIVEEKIPDNIKTSSAVDSIRGGERSLANHLKNPDGEQDAAADKETLAIPYVPEDPKLDAQLQYALDYLKKLPAGSAQATVPPPTREFAASAPAPTNK